MVVETRARLLVECPPDGAVLGGRGGDFNDMPPRAPCGRALFGQRFGGRLVLRILVLVQLVQNERADGLVAQTRDGTRPAQINGHVRQIDAQTAGIVAAARHVLAQTRTCRDHGDDAVARIFPRRDFIRENIHRRAGAAVNAPAHEIVRGLGAAGLRAFADDDGFHAGRAHSVHDAREIGREDVLPAARNAGHFKHAVLFGPLADRYGPTPPEQLALAPRKDAAQGGPAGQRRAHALPHPCREGGNAHRALLLRQVNQPHLRHGAPPPAAACPPCPR